MPDKKTYWTIVLKGVSNVVYYNVENPIASINGYLKFIDPDTERRVWISLAASWYATEQKEKLRRYR